MIAMGTAEIDVVTALSGAQLDECTAMLKRLVLGGAALGWIVPPSRAQVAEWIGGLAADVARGEAVMVVAVDAGRLAGVGCWRRYARPTLRPHVDVERLFVDPSRHGSGVGRAMLHALIDEARAQAVEVVTLDFRDGNPAAERLYRSVGFREHGRLPRFIAFGEERFDQRLFSLDLRDATG